MPVPSPVAWPRATLAAAVADLNDLVLFGDLDNDQIDALTNDVSALTGRTPGQRDPSWITDSFDTAYASRSPFAGVENPRSPRMVVTRLDPTETSDPSLGRVALGTVTVPPAFAGPPHVVHGGIVSGLLDEVIGWLASGEEPNAMVVTAKLAVRFCQPTPVNVALRLQAQLERRTSRCMTIVAKCVAGDTITATADALMVVRR